MGSIPCVLFDTREDDAVGGIALRVIFLIPYICARCPNPAQSQFKSLGVIRSTLVL